MQGLAYIFINYLQAGRLGHIGWGLTAADGVHFFGSSDHLWGSAPMNDLRAWIEYSCVTPGNDMDWWLESGSRDEMLATMSAGHHIKYHDYKVVEVENAQAQLAIEFAQEISQRGWHVISHNCVHHTHQILSRYGAGSVLPSPLIPIPRLWFKSIATSPQFLRTRNCL